MTFDLTDSYFTTEDSCIKELGISQENRYCWNLII